MRKLFTLGFLLLTSYTWGTIVGTNLDNNGSIAGTNSYSTASITPTSNQPVFITITATLSSGNGPGTISTVTGNGITYAKVTSSDYGPVENVNFFAGHIETWCGINSSPSTGAITFTFAGGVSPTSVSWNVSKFSGTYGQGATCAGLIGSITKATDGSTQTASPASVAISFSNPANGTYGATGCFGNTFISAGTSMTDLGHVSGQTASAESEWAAGNVSPVTTTYSGNAACAIIAIELLVVPNSGHRPLSF